MRAFAVLLVPCLLLGCDDAVESDLVTTGELEAQRQLESTSGWESVPFPAPADCEGGEVAPLWLEFRKQSEQRSLTIQHELGRVPAVVLPYLSKSNTGCGSTLAAGEAVIVDFADADIVQLRNNTDDDYWLRVVLQ